MPVDVAVIGDGAWGTALALLLARNGHRVRLWSPFPDAAARMRDARENAAFLPGIPLPTDLDITADPATAVRGVAAAVLAVPTRYFRNSLVAFRPHLPAGCHVVSVAKGLDAATHERMSVVAEQVLGVAPVAALSGPSYALEVARGIPTAVTVACPSHPVGVALQSLFNNAHFRVYTATDIVGVELGGAFKNVIAIAVGVSDGLGFGDNTRAALITRGLAEMSRLGCALGAAPTTFAGLTGIGDLIVTCTGRLSRNRGFGERIGRGEKAGRILAETKQAIEGAWNCASAVALARDAGVEVPIMEQVHGLVHEDRDPREAVEALLSREVKPE